MNNKESIAEFKKSVEIVKSALLSNFLTAVEEAKDMFDIQIALELGILADYSIELDWLYSKYHDIMIKNTICLN